MHSPTPWRLDRENGVLLDARGDLVALVDGLAPENERLMLAAVSREANRRHDLAAWQETMANRREALESLGVLRLE